MASNQCLKAERVGRHLVVCILPLHHEPIVWPAGSTGPRKVVHCGMLSGKRHDWEDEG